MTTEPRITVVFRMDDYASVSWTELELRIIEAFRKRALRCTFGVIPYTGWGDTGNPLPSVYLPLVPEKVAILKRAVADGTIDVAQHGYCHQPFRGKPTEFAALPLDVQREKIRRGAAFLSSSLETKSSVFIPPWNSYDRNTLRALDSLGFIGISAGKCGAVEGGLSLRFLPATCSLTGLKGAVAAARRASAPSSIVTVLFHPSDFRDHSPARGVLTIEELDVLLDWVCVQPDLEVLPVSECMVHGDLSPVVFKANRPIDLLPPFLDRGMRYVLLPASPAIGIRRRSSVTAGLVYAALFLACLLAAMAADWIFRPGFGLTLIAASTTVLAAAACLIYAFRDGSISYRGLAVTLPLFSAGLAFWSRLFLLTR